MRINIAPLLLLFLLSGCTGYQYVSSPNYVPLNTRKGDLKANISLGHAQVGYSVGNHISVFATGYQRNQGTFINFEKWGTKEGGGANSYRDHSYEINGGASYFKTTNKFIYEVHAGAGGGEVYYMHDKDLQDGYHFEMNANKVNVFIQPSFSYRLPNFKKFKTEDFIQYGAFTKVVAYQYYNLDVKSGISSRITPDKEDQFFMNRKTQNLYFIEPGIVFRAGCKWVKGNTIISLPLNLEGDKIRHRSFNLYLSAFVSLNVLKKKDKDK